MELHPTTESKSWEPSSCAATESLQPNTEPETQFFFFNSSRWKKRLLFSSFPQSITGGVCWQEAIVPKSLNSDLRWLFRLQILFVSMFWSRQKASWKNKTSKNFVRVILLANKVKIFKCHMRSGVCNFILCLFFPMFVYLFWIGTSFPVTKQTKRQQTWVCWPR